MERLYIERIRNAFLLECFSLANVPLALFFLYKGQEKVTLDYQARKRFRFGLVFILVSQLNLAFLGQYYRKVKRYPFEDKLIVKHMQEIRELDPNYKP